MNTRRTETQLPNDGPPCIWMQAGVVRHKRCRINYDCPSCHFDETMQKIAAENRESRAKGQTPTGRKGEIAFWTDKMRELPIRLRPCIHHMKRRINFRACTNDYRCSNCDFDQYFSDQFAVHAVVRSIEVLDVGGIKAPQGYYLHCGHAWAKIEEGQSVRIGVDDFAARLIGPLDRVDIPLIGTAVRQNQPGFTLKRGEKQARVLMPVSGVVTAANSSLHDQAGLVNQESYSGGWVLQVQADNLRSDIKALMIKKETRDFIKTEIDQLYAVIEDSIGPLAADGGQLGEDISGNLPPDAWETIRRRFFRT